MVLFMYYNENRLKLFTGENDFYVIDCCFKEVSGLCVDCSIEDPIEDFKKLSANYERAFLFNDYEFFEYINGAFVELDRSDFEICICPECGQIILKKESVLGMCEDCYFQSAKQKMEEIYASMENEYTPFEAYSKAVDFIENCKILLPEVTRKNKEKIMGIISEKVKEILNHNENYIQEVFSNV